MVAIIATLLLSPVLSSIHLVMAQPSSRAKLCYICSTDQDPIFHEHNSPREIRIMQMVEYEETNLTYMCTTCNVIHQARPDTEINICVVGDQLHNIHTPRSTSSPSMKPDPVHIDWLTVCNASIAEMEYAWLRDY